MKVDNLQWKQQIKYFFLGAGSIGAILLLSGSTDYAKSSLNFGRYQISSWATQLSEDSGVVGAFVMDTVSGETKTVYIRTYGNIGKNNTVKNDLKKPYSAID